MQNAKKMIMRLWSISFPFLELYGFIKFGQYQVKDGVDICCLVSVNDGKDLANVTIRNTESKSLKTITNELNQSASNLRHAKNEKHNQKMSLVSFIPVL